MKSYVSRNTIALRKRVKKAHAKAKFAGVLYLLGTLALVAFACMPMLKIGGSPLSITNCFAMISGVSLGTISAVLYLLIVLTCVVNFFKCFRKLGWLSKRSERYVNGFNRNAGAMELMGKFFSRSFSRFINLYFLIYILNNASFVNVTMAYLVLAIGLVVHFFAGVVGGKVSYFNVGGPNGEVEEEKRSISMFVYFFRNLVQVAVTAFIIYTFAPISKVGDIVSGILGGGSMPTGIVSVAIQAAIVLFTLVLVKHATGITEYNRFGIEGAGMKNNKIFSFLVAVVAGAAYALKMAEPVDAYMTIAVAAFVSFLVDCIFKSKFKDKENKPSKKQRCREKCEEKPCVLPQSIPMQQPIINVQQPNSPQQPIFVPVYYPVPMSQPVPQQPVVHERHTVVPYPMPYPMPMAAPYARPAQRPMQAPCAPAPMPAAPFGMPPARPMPNPTVCANAQQCPIQAPVAPVAPAPAPAPAPVAPAPAPVCVIVRPEPAPAPAHLQAKPVETGDKPKTKKQLRKEKKEEKAQAKFLKKSKKSAKKAAKLEKQVAKTEKKEKALALKKANSQEKKAAAIAAKSAKAEQKFVAAERKLILKEKKAALRSKPVVPVVEQPILEQPVVEQPVVEEVVPPQMESNVFNPEPQEIQIPLDPNKRWNVRCPQCGKQLSVRDVSPYHRCPSCDKVFSLRKFETYVKKN